MHSNDAKVTPKANVSTAGAIDKLVDTRIKDVKPSGMTMQYAAPEVLMSTQVQHGLYGEGQHSQRILINGCAADMWSFGCVLYELLTGCKAFPLPDKDSSQTSSSSHSSSSSRSRASSHSSSSSKSTSGSICWQCGQAMDSQVTWVRLASSSTLILLKRTHSLQYTAFCCVVKLPICLDLP